MPAVCTTLAEAFPNCVCSTTLAEALPSCEGQDNVPLMATDLSIECDTDRHRSLVAYAWLMMLVWPIGVS